MTTSNAGWKEQGFGNQIALGSDPGSALMGPWATYLTPSNLVFSSVKKGIIIIIIIMIPSF